MPACQVSLRHDSHAIVRYEGVVVIVIPVNLSAVTQRISSESIILSKWIGHCIKKIASARWTSAANIVIDSHMRNIEQFTGMDHRGRGTISWHTLCCITTA